MFPTLVNFVSPLIPPRVSLFSLYLYISYHLIIEIFLLIFLIYKESNFNYIFIRYNILYIKKYTSTMNLRPFLARITQMQKISNIFRISEKNNSIKVSLNIRKSTFLHLFFKNAINSKKVSHMSFHDLIYTKLLLFRYSHRFHFFVYYIFCLIIQILLYI